MKRMVIMVLLVLFSLGLLSVAEAVSSGDYRYKLNDDGSATITRYYGDDAALQVPTEYMVTGIGDDAFIWCETLARITIPASVTEIGEEVFEGCSEYIMLTVERGSYAAEYAKENGLNYTYPDANDWLNG